MNRILSMLALTFLAGTAAFSQGDPGGSASKDLIQLSGVVVSGDSLTPVPFTSVWIKNSHRGTICDYYGFFSLVVRKGDTIEFSSLGYGGAEVVIPDTLTDNRYSMIQMLQRDTVLLKEQVVYPWPSRQQFREAFLTLNAPDDDYDRAFRNMTREDVRLAIQGVPMGAESNYNYTMRQEYTRLYQQGQMPQITLLNPLAWAQFIEAWKRGAFKPKK